MESPQALGFVEQSERLFGNSHAIAGLSECKQLRRSPGRHSDAAVARRVIRDDALVHSEIATTQPLEIRHAGVIQRGRPIPVFVGDGILARRCRKPPFARRGPGFHELFTLGVINYDLLLR